jgi:hypothetical protein
MSGTVHRRHPATLLSVAALFVVLVLAGHAVGRTASPGAGMRAVLGVAQAETPKAVDLAGTRPVRGRAVAILTTPGSGPTVAGLVGALAAPLALLVVRAATWRPRRRHIGRMHAGRGPPAVVA